jgi:hypothetical protein
MRHRLLHRLRDPRQGPLPTKTHPPGTHFAEALGIAGCALLTPLLANAALNDVGQAPPSVHRLKLFVDPQVVEGIGATEVGRRLSQYVADVNTVFRRETVRSFVFDPASDMQLVNPAAAPRCSDDDPVDGEIVVCISRSELGYSHGGLSKGWPHPQKGVAWNLNWVAIHDPLRLSRTVSAVPALLAGITESTESDYLGRQLQAMVRELECVFGACAGAGEHGGTALVLDTSGVPPVTDLSLRNDADRYWWTRQNWRLDPMFGSTYTERRTPSINRVLTLGLIRFTAGTRAAINTDWSEWPRLRASDDMTAAPARTAKMAAQAAASIASTAVTLATSATQVRVTDLETGATLPAARVAVWRNPGGVSRKPLVLLAQGVADGTGRFSFDWNCELSCAGSASSMLLVKASATGRAAGATWFTIHDAFEQKAVQHRAALTIDLALGPGDSQPPRVTLVAPAVAVEGRRTALTAVVADNAGMWGAKLMEQNGVAICTFTASEQSCDWTPTTPGLQTLQLIGMDVAGNESTASVDVVVSPPDDMIAPSVAVLAPRNAAVGTLVALSGTASDNVGVVKLKFIVGGKTLCVVTSMPYTCSWRPAMAEYANIEMRATDAAGNVGTASTRTRVQPAMPAAGAATDAPRTAMHDKSGV